MEENALAKWLENRSQEMEDRSEPELTNVLDQVDRFEQPVVNADALFEKIQNAKKLNSEKEPRSNLRFLRIASLAAAVAAMLIAFNFFGVEKTTVDSFSGTIVNHELPDQSVVKLNSNSSIEYKSDFENRRKLYLKGEGFFEVEKGKQFSVITDQGSVRVLGTSFNVFARENHFVVACKTGKVEVSVNGNSAKIGPGQVIRVQSEELNLSEEEVRNIGEWDQSETSFQNAPLGEVLSSLAAKYNLTLEPLRTETSTMNYTGNYVHDDLDKALKMVCLPMGIEYSINQDNHLNIRN